MSHLRLTVKLVGMGVLLALVTPSQWLVLRFTRGPGATVLPRWFFCALCRLFGLQVELLGRPESGQVVFASNHLSHLDIAAIGSRVPASFVAKEDIRAWPIAGWLAALQQTVFVSRNPRHAVNAAARLSEALAAGRSLVLFPEGTTSDGSAVLPFKSSAFCALEDPRFAHINVQPVSIELVSVDGCPIAEGGNRDAYAYYGEMNIVTHLLAFLRGSGAQLRVHFHPSLLLASDHIDRKRVAAEAHATVAR